VVETWTLSKPEVEGSAGVVASQHHAASEVGAQVLAAGGNAVDAAVATGLAIGAVEPWMSGLGGGGFMLVQRADEAQAQAIDFAMVAPERLDPAAYPVIGSAADHDLFGWPAVEGDRNLEGATAFAVPGLVAGLSLALERFGTRPWAEMLAPAIELARAGLTVDWYATLTIANSAQALARHPETARVYLPEGLPPAGEWGRPPPRLPLHGLAATLERLAEAGPRDFYEGDVAAAIAADCARAESPLAAADLARYEARLVPAAGTEYRGADVFSAPGLSAGPTLMAALTDLEARSLGKGSLDASAYLAYAECLSAAYRDRLATLGHASGPSCTTHISVADREGNVVALTQTLLSLFGSKAVLPETGILMNNGVMWFDPVPGRPNSIAAGQRPLSNMCPTIVTCEDGVRVALGASGGRRILPAVFQIISFLTDFGMGPGEAIGAPRIDVSGGELIGLESRLGPAVREAIAGSFQTGVDHAAVYPTMFACPNLVIDDRKAGRQSGAAHVHSPWAQAVAASEIAGDIAG
jgi:gamma-glutamyltranspeptidase/glutathione hydrolase